MLRRNAIATLAAAFVPARADQPKSLSEWFDTRVGAALLADVRTRRLLAGHALGTASGMLAPPGSTLKPFALAALLETGKLGAQERYVCPGTLQLGGRSFACSHPPMAGPMEARMALAYSCNCFVTHFAARFAAGELSMALARYGLSSRTGWFGEREGLSQVLRAQGESGRMQAIGEDGVLVTAGALALAYRRLALNAARPWMAPVLAGMEDAVEFGTARRARVTGLAVAGKTGSVRAADGAFIAWFAGFAPSRDPAVVVTVMLQGRSGGADAAPIAGRILEAWARGAL